MELSEQGVSTNRGMIKRTFQAKGIEYAGQLFQKNAEDLIKVIQWNHENGIVVYRMSSCLCPWMSEFELKDLPNYKEIKETLQLAGQLATEYGQRLSFHPGQFTIIASANEDIVTRGIKDLNQHSEIMDMLGLPASPYAAINIHIGGAYGDKPGTMQRFCKNFYLLDQNTQKRLVVENDDKGSMYSTQDLYDGVYKVTGTPITFDFHHHRFNTAGLTEEEALKLASQTWPSGIKQLTHYSSCKLTHEAKEKVKPQAHADYVYEEINTYGLDIDIEVEAKAKEKAVQKYWQQTGKKALLEEYIPFS